MTHAPMMCIDGPCQLTDLVAACVLQKGCNMAVQGRGGGLFAVVNQAVSLQSCEDSPV